MDMLLYVATGFIIFSYIFYLILIFIGRMKKISDSTGFDVAKNVLDEYGRINIIEGNYSFSFYNLRRRVIKLSRNDYYGNNLSSMALSLFQAGISICENKFIDFFKKIFPTLKVIELFGVISLILNYISTSVSDAKIGIFIMGIIVVVRYFYIEILCNSYNFILDKKNKIKEIERNNMGKLLSFIDKIIICNRLQFIGELIILIRFVMILLNF